MNRRKNSAMTGGLRLGLPALILLLMTAFAVWGNAILKDDPWKSTDYKNWTNDDVQKILYESPWVKMVEVTAPWIKGQSHYLTPMPSDCNGRPDMNHNKIPASWAMGSTESVVIYQVTWQSSRTVRAAKLREAVLCGRTDPDRGDDLLEQTPEQYVIVVSSPDMTPFDGMSEDALAKNTSLTFKKNQKKINPESVLIQHFGQGSTVYSITFKFARKTDTGESLMMPDEKEIEFVTQSGKFAIRTKFQPPKMPGKNGPDL